MSRWIEVTLPATPDTLDDITARLIAEGFESFQIVDRRDLDAARPAWELFDEELLRDDTCKVVLYLPEGDEESFSVLRQLFPDAMCGGTPRNEEEWADAWKQYYKPTPVGVRLLIQPAWLPLEDTEGRAVFLNNPGMSFGTGLHASTRLCLELLESENIAGRRVLDIGCGSGILGLCGLVLGAESAVGVDIDPSAAETARENARLNGVDSRYTAFAGDYLSDDSLRQSVGTGYDMIFSNIVADIIIALAPLIAPQLQSNTGWVVSGIIEPRLDDVLNAAKKENLTAAQILHQDGWCAVRFEKVF